MASCVITTGLSAAIVPEVVEVLMDVINYIIGSGIASMFATLSSLAVLDALDYSGMSNISLSDLRTLLGLFKFHKA